jgi:hypothetical protein
MWDLLASSYYFSYLNLSKTCTLWRFE